jgi:cell division protein FtsQ
MPEKHARRVSAGHVRRHLTWIGAGLVVVFLVAGVTYYLSTLTVEKIVVDGSVHATEDVVARLSGIVPGDTLYRLEPDAVAGRVALHPWVDRADVTRWPTGVLSIDVEERVPVALSVSATGEPVYYLDRWGESMPVDSVSRYDVPLLRGIANGSRPVTVRDSLTVELLGVLAALPPSVDGLLSDLIVRADGEVDVVTVPVHDGDCILVRMGRGDYDRKMRTLRAFWTQAVAGHPEKRIESIDLRFRGQVVTKEESVIS